MEIEPKSRCTIHIISRDAWGIISANLQVQDLLALRRACKALNKIVIGMNVRWYKAHQWFVKRHKSGRNVKSAVRVHNVELQASCFPSGYVIPNLHKYTVRSQESLDHWSRNAIFQMLIADEVFLESDCQNKYHYAWKVPASEQEIPLDKHYKPKRNQYIFWYLIECYRQYSAPYLHQISYAKTQIENCENQITQFKKDLKNLNSGKYGSNTIFKKVRINSYKSF